MATASANAMARIAMVCTLDDASGFLPIASTAFEPIQPIASAGSEGTDAHHERGGKKPYTIGIE